MLIDLRFSAGVERCTCLDMCENGRRRLASREGDALTVGVKNAAHWSAELVRFTWWDPISCGKSMARDCLRLLEEKASQSSSTS